MNVIYEHFFLLSSFIIWAILLTAFFCYGLLLDLCFFQHKDLQWGERTTYWSSSLKTILAALPLLGLLGTISGLLTTFAQMSQDGGFDLQQILTGGIAEAMFTTQLGLVMVIPGILLLKLLDSQKKKWFLRSLDEVID